MFKPNDFFLQVMSSQESESCSSEDEFLSHSSVTGHKSHIPDGELSLPLSFSHSLCMCVRKFLTL